MRISSEAWARYQRAHAMLQGEAKQLLEEYFDSLPWDEDEPRCLTLLARRAVELYGHYGLADATLSAAFYDEVMEMQGANVPQAVMPELSPRFVAQDVRRSCGRARSRETARSMSSAALSGHVKRAGIETMRTNAVRDHAMWAWVCIGDSCAFCRTLGSNGWQQASKSILNGRHAEHIHDGCDCQFVVKMPGQNLDIDGYDPDALREEYEDAGGRDSQDRINAMRRADYTPEKAAERNARRRELYAEEAAEREIKAKEQRYQRRIDEAEMVHPDFYSLSIEEVTRERKRYDSELRSEWNRYKAKSKIDGVSPKVAYDTTVGAYFSALSTSGRMTIETFVDMKNNKGHEAQLAKWFADAGHTVILRQSGDGSTNDALIDEVAWEFKRVTSGNTSKISRRVKEHIPRQGPLFVVDLSESTIKRSAAEWKIAELLDEEGVEEILLVMEGNVKHFRR